MKKTNRRNRGRPSLRRIQNRTHNTCGRVRHNNEEQEATRYNNTVAVIRSLHCAREKLTILTANGRRRRHRIRREEIIEEQDGRAD